MGCNTPKYNKGDGFPACGIVLDGAFDFFEAEGECEKKGGKLPEIYSEEENNIIMTFNVKTYVLMTKASINLIQDFFDQGKKSTALARNDQVYWKKSGIKLSFNRVIAIPNYILSNTTFL